MAEGDQATLPGTDSDQLTLDTLETHLWAAADKLRGSIDSADYKKNFRLAHLGSSRGSVSKISPLKSGR